MLLHEKDGIICDLCSTIFRNDFNYYNVEGTTITANKGATVSRSMPIIDIDICQSCFDKFINDCMKHLHNNQKTTKCEMCGKLYIGNYTYIYLIMAKVIVTPPSKSEKHELVIDKEVMDLKVGECCFPKLKTTTEDNKRAYSRTAQKTQ